VCLGPYGSGVQYGVHNPDVFTAERGVLERVFFHEENGQFVAPYCPPRQVFSRVLGQARRTLLRHTNHVNPYTEEQFLNCYAARKRSAYEQAFRSLEVKPLERKDSYLQTFVKAEKLNLSAKPDPTPRVIQPRNKRYNARVGLYIKACEHMIYQAINRMWAGTTVMKGLNADQRGQAFAEAWESFDDPVAVGVDAKRFDEHVSRTALEFEHSIYNAVFQSAELRELLRWQLVNRGFVRADDGSIDYQVEGRRMSGDMNTSLGNVILMCVMMWAYARTKPFRVALKNDGDDCVLIVERRNVADLADMPQWFEQLGFLLEVEATVDELEKVVFCQSQPVFDGNSWRMVRDPRVCLSKDMICVKPVVNEVDYSFYRRAIGQCGLALAGDMPVYGAYYSMMVRGTEAADSSALRRKRKGKGVRELELETGMQYLALGMDHSRSDPTTAARYSFWRAFGMTPDLQVALEREFDSSQMSWGRMDRVLEFGQLLVAGV
jgi:hypothetical protein